MTLREWRWKVFRYWFCFAAAAVFIYCVASGFVEADRMGQEGHIPFQWWHPRIALAMIAIASGVGVGFSGELPERPNPPSVDEEVMEEVRRHLRK